MVRLEKITVENPLFLGAITIYGTSQAKHKTDGQGKRNQR